MFLLASALLLAGRVAAQCGTSGGMTQSGSNNYVVDTFTNTLLFSYAINQCTGISLADSSVFYKYTCKKDGDDMWWVTRSSYATADCSDSVIDADTWGESDAVAGEAGYFKCDGNNNYAAIQIGLDNLCGGTTTIVGGLGGCASNPSVYDTKFYCDDAAASVQLYENPTTGNSTYSMCDDSHLYCAKWTFPTTCTLGAQFLGQNVYGLMTKCALTEAGNEDDSDSSASSQFTLVGIVVALIAGLFH